MSEQKRQVICWYSVGARFVGTEATGQTVKKFAERTLCVSINAREFTDPADKPNFPMVPGYDACVRDRILALVPEGWLDGIWKEQVLPKVEELLQFSEKYDYLQFMVICGAGFQRSPAIASALYERMCKWLCVHYGDSDWGVHTICEHLSANLAHRIKMIGLR